MNVTFSIEKRKPKESSMQSESLMVYRDGIALRNTDELNYLGVYVNNSFDLHTHFENPTKKQHED